MILTEMHTIKRNKKTEDLFKQIDGYCFASKNLRNSTNYLIKQCSRISRKMQEGNALEDWEKDFVRDVNRAVLKYNKSGRTVKHTKTISKSNGFIADAYFLNWYLKATPDYKSIPYATCARDCIQLLCRDWKSFYADMRIWQKTPQKLLGRPRTPRYYDKVSGRNWLDIQGQNLKVSENDHLILPKVFGGIDIKLRHTEVVMISIVTTKKAIKVRVCYRQNEESKTSGKNIMGVDLGVDNFAAVSFSNKTSPMLINGKSIKSINQFYNKEKARLQEIAKKTNNRYTTARMCRLTERRNNKVADYMHKASRKIIDLAIQNKVGVIVIGNNRGWKQSVEMGKKNNQHFVGIPYFTFIQMVSYKASMAGIEVKVVDEAYTSGTSYLDGEMPTKESYDKSRRLSRGRFLSNSGECINADVNGAYQIIKKFDAKIPIKHRERVIRMNVA